MAKKPRRVAPGKLSAIRGRGWQTFGKMRADCNALAGAGSVVVRDIPAYEIWAGSPARKLGERR